MSNDDQGYSVFRVSVPISVACLVCIGGVVGVVLPQLVRWIVYRVQPIAASIIAIVIFLVGILVVVLTLLSKIEIAEGEMKITNFFPIVLTIYDIRYVSRAAGFLPGYRIGYVDSNGMERAAPAFGVRHEREFLRVLKANNPRIELSRSLARRVR